VSRQRRIQIIAAIIVVAGVLGALLLRHYDRFPTTDDAYVEANVVGIVAQVAGPIVDLPIRDNQPVRAGELLFSIDPRPFQIAVDQARAELDRTGQDVTALADAVSSAEAGVRYNQAALRLAQTQWRRVEPLAKIGAVPFQDRDKAQANLDGARAGLDNAKAELAQAQANLGEFDENNPDIRAAVAQLDDAELKLSYATVAAPVNGLVTDLDLSLGTYATVGSPLLSLVNTDSWRVVAYYKETQLERIQPGQPAAVYLPAYPGVRFEGQVQGVGWGVEQQGSDGERGPDGVPTVSPTVDWVRMAQRFPVRITLPDLDPDHPLRKGMRATVRIDTTVDPEEAAGEEAAGEEAAGDEAAGGDPAGGS
jgi:multidrug resistance efflux pump